MIDQLTIRKDIQAQREALNKKQQEQKSRKICQQVVDSGVLNNAQHIAFYLPVRGEADPTYLQAFTELSNKHFYLPILSVKRKHHLEFALYNQDTPMTLNRFKIPEPDPNSAILLDDTRALDAVIMPMVAIDRLGNRIGMGGGFYDRTFAFRKNEKCSPQLVAFAYDFQLIDQQEPQSWDVPADSVALQTEFFDV